MATNQEFSPFITEMDRYLFGSGTHYDIYKKLGAHISEKDGEKGVYFAVWAPKAKSVSVIGDFNDWNEDADKMEKTGDVGIFELFIPGITAGVLYKYLIESAKGEKLYKADPYANYAELRPGTASIVTDLTKFKWSDTTWLKKRNESNLQEIPMAIYECHIGSWMRHPGREDEGFYTYRQFADRIVIGAAVEGTF